MLHRRNSAFRVRHSFGIRSSIFGLLFCLSTAAQDYAINWHTIDGGGGSSTGGVYSVTGTIGQPDATTTTMTGGPYSVTGGFWPLHAVQTPEAPFLTIAPAGPGKARVSWTPTMPGWVLHETTSLSPTNWIECASGSTNPVVVPATGGMRFYRLSKP